MRAMKDSGVEWIGEIPQDWDRTKLLNLLRVPISDGPHETPKLINSGIPFISVDSVGNGENIDLTVCKKFISEEDYINYSKKTKIESGDILFTKAATIGKTAIVRDEIFMVWSPIAIIKTNNEIVHNKYIYYVLSSSEFIKHVSLLGSYNTQINVGMRELERAMISLPPKDKQKSIVAYLDSKCSKIDTIIEKQQAVIEKLKEYKLSVITEAVTKGLNPDVEMKDSGVEWIGEVPRHWEVVKFGRCISIASNLVNPNNYLDYPQVSPECIEKNTAKLLDYKTVFESGVISWNHLFYKGQIIYSKIRPLLNKVIIAPFDGLCSADMYPIDTAENHKFIVYVILSNYFKAQVGVVIENRVKMPKINQSELSNIVVFMPCIDEQKRIVEFLDEECEKIERLIASKELLIKKLMEYKKSLIYEVVTGKKEV